MTKEEMDSVWSYLSKFRVGDPKSKDDELRAAWWSALGRYEARDVKRAIVEHYRASKYWPDIPEIMARLPKLPPQRDMRGYQPDKTIAELRDIYFAEIVPARRAAGIPVGFAEARRAGLSAEEYDDLLDKHHLGVSDALAMMERRKGAACCGNEG